MDLHGSLKLLHYELIDGERHGMKRMGERGHTFGKYPSHIILFSSNNNHCNCNCNCHNVMNNLYFFDHCYEIVPLFVAFIFTHCGWNVWYTCSYKTTWRKWTCFGKQKKFLSFVCNNYPCNCHTMLWTTWIASVVVIKLYSCSLLSSPHVVVKFGLIMLKSYYNVTRNVLDWKDAYSLYVYPKPTLDLESEGLEFVLSMWNHPLWMKGATSPYNSLCVEDWFLPTKFHYP